MSEEEIKECLDSLYYQNNIYNINYNKLKDYIIKLKTQLQQKENIIKEVREEVRIYEEQSNDGATNELDNYVFVQRLKNVLDRGE